MGGLHLDTPGRKRRQRKMWKRDRGLGQALLENCAYDAESGQLIAATFMDYTMRPFYPSPSPRDRTKVRMPSSSRKKKHERHGMDINKDNRCHILKHTKTLIPVSVRLQHL